MQAWMTHYTQERGSESRMELDNVQTLCLQNNIKISK
jgi:hypothetical protein